MLFPPTARSRKNQSRVQLKRPLPSLVEKMERRVLLDATVVGGLPMQPDSSLPENLTVVGDRMYFTADAGGFGRELWQTDGTPQGTTLVKDINPGPGSSNPGQLTANGNLLYFTVPGTNSTAHLWRSNGTAAGTFQLDTSLTRFDSFVGLGGVLYFGGAGPGNDTEFWKTDGTPAGTIEVKQINHIPSFFGPLNVVNGLVQFYAQDDNRQLNLWQSDGTAEGTQIIAAGLTGYPNNGGSPDPNDLGTVDGHSFFLRGDTVWTSDGTTQGTVPLKTFAPFQRLIVIANYWPAPVPHASFQHKLFFVADDGQTGFELWQSDGTPAGTTLFDDLSSGSVSASAPLPGASILPFPGEGPPGELTTANGKLFFTEPVYLWHSDLWVTDPSSNSAQDIYAINGGGQDAVFGLTAVGNRVFLGRSVGDGLSDDLGVTDGTLAGTQILVSIPQFRRIDKLNGRALFRGENTVLWSSDGSNAGTVPLAARLGELDPAEPVISGPVAFFSTEDQGGFALWKTDGSTAGTVKIAPLPGNPGSAYVFSMRSIAGGVTFAIHDYTTGTDTNWVSDGTAAGTHPVVTPPVPPPSTTGVVYNGRTYYAGDDGVHGVELISTDGTAAGTHLVADINPGPGSSNPTSLTITRGLLYFNAYRPDIGNELWSTDGTAAGTRLVQDLYPGPGSSNPQQITDVNGTLYFVASDPLHRNALWKLPVGGPPNVPLDFSYLLTLAQHYGQHGTFATGDLNDDGMVNFDDLTILAQNFGHPLEVSGAKRRLSLGRKIMSNRP